MVLSISHGILWVCACVCVCALSFEHHTLSADHMKHDKILVSNVIISRMCVPLNIRDVQFHMGLPSSWDTKPSKSDFFLFTIQNVRFTGALLVLPMLLLISDSPN